MVKVLIHFTSADRRLVPIACLPDSALHRRSNRGIDVVDLVCGCDGRCLLANLVGPRDWLSGSGALTMARCRRLLAHPIRIAIRKTTDNVTAGWLLNFDCRHAPDYSRHSVRPARHFTSYSPHSSALPGARDPLDQTLLSTLGVSDERTRARREFECSSTALPVASH